MRTYGRITVKRKASAAYTAIPPAGAANSLAAGTNIGDADTAINPATDQCSIYTLPAGTLTADRIVTVNNTSQTATQVCQIVRRDRTAHSLTIKNSGGTTLYTSNASPTRDVIYQLYYTGGVWTPNSIYFVS